jgi:hypothetical protein
MVNVIYGRDDVYPARTSRVGSLLHYVITYLGLTGWWYILIGCCVVCDVKWVSKVNWNNVFSYCWTIRLSGFRCDGIFGCIIIHKGFVWRFCVLVSVVTYL